MIRKFFLFFISFFILSFASTAFAQQAQIDEYSKFLKSNGTDPVEYFVNLFDNHKIVVFCESWHPEMTQYEFLGKVIRHPKFIKNVRAVFTEIGSSSQQHKMNEFLKSDSLNDGYLIDINRENTLHPTGWPNKNIILFWTELWKVNSTLGENDKVWAYLSDIEWNWKSLRTKNDYDKLIKSRDVKYRDQAMARIIIEKIDEIEKNISSDKNVKNKFLVVMNTRHALGMVTQRTYDTSGMAKYPREEQFGDNTCCWLKQYYGQKQVFNVFYHQAKAYASGFFLIQKGKWDTAFKLNGYKPVGFDLKDSPFGNDAFDYHSGFHTSSYAGAFDGFVFYKPLFEHYAIQAYEGFYHDDNFLKEIERRCYISGRNNVIAKWITEKGVQYLDKELPNSKTFLYSKDQFERSLKKQVWTALPRK